MTLRHPVLFLIVLGLMIAIGPLEWIVYAIEVTIWNINNPDYRIPY